MNTEDVQRRVKRRAAEVGIDLIDLRTTTEEEEFLELCGLPSDLRTKGKHSDLIREQQAEHTTEQTVFKVSIVVTGALRSHGSRGNVYKTLEKCRGCFLKSAGKEVEYVNDAVEGDGEHDVFEHEEDEQGAALVCSLAGEPGVADSGPRRSARPARAASKKAESILTG